jgi:tetratricopeptide (TPR) repeat protein
MKQDFSKDFFISYTSVDHQWAEWIAWQLEEAGYSTVLQAWDFRPGSNFVLDMHRAAAEAKHTITVLSPDYLNALYTQPEWATAFARDPTGEMGLMLPIRVHRCELNGLLSQIVYIDLEGLREQEAREVLLQGVQCERVKPTTSPKFPIETRSAINSRPRFPGSFPRFWNIPYQRKPFFIGREDILRRLYETLRVGESAALVQPQALIGLGGIGKTQTAVEYVYRYYSDYPEAIFWVRADSRESLLSDFTSIAYDLNLLKKDEQDQRLAALSVKRWLKEYDGWLLILDNVEDLEMIKDFMPSARRGDIVLTTRQQITGDVAQAIEIENMEPDEGALFLLRRTKILKVDDELANALQTDRATAREIATALGGLPLALDQAGAYIEETRCGLLAYLDLYRTNRKELLNRRSTFRSDHPESVAMTWALSFQQIEQANPAAADLLRLCAFLDPNVIPEELITASASELGPNLKPVAANAFRLNGAIEELLKFSLVKRNSDEKILSIHRLVQTILIDRMNKRTRQLWAKRVVRAVNQGFPDADYKDWASIRRYLPNALASATLIEQYELAFPEAARLMHQVGTYLDDHAHYIEAEALFQRALAIRERVLGSEHPDTASSLNNLAILYSKRGEDTQAEALFQRALAIRERVLGPDHPYIASCLANLAILNIKRGENRQAEAFFQRALAIQVAILGSDHPDTASSLNNLAILYSAQGKVEQAEPLFQQALAVRERALGSDHPDTASSLINLAILYSTQGKDEQAVTLFQRALEIQESVLGPDHPDTASSIINLAVLYSNQGKDDQARSYRRRAWEYYQNALEIEHPNEELRTYFLGEPVRPLIVQHYIDSQRLTRQIADYHRAELKLTSKLTRWDCPSSQVLGEYQLGLLKNDHATAVKIHVSSCVFCSVEMATLTQFLINDPIFAGHEFVQAPTINNEWAKYETNSIQDVQYDQGISGVRHIIATLLPAQPRFAYMRDTNTLSLWPRHYTAEDLSISMMLEEGKPLELIGLVTRKDAAMDALKGTPVILSSEINRVYTQSIDELGNFSFGSISPATYKLELRLPEGIVVIDRLPVTL